VGVQLFGADGQRMGEAARKVIDWKRPDFIDINFGCPVNKVVSKNGGSSLLRDCPLLASVAEGVVKAVAPTGVPVTAKIRIGWDAGTINARQVVSTLEECGIAAVAIHGRTRSQGYSGEADWAVIAECAEGSPLPVIGNGDIASGAEVAMRQRTTKVAGVMIGRAALGHPWIFREAREYLDGGRVIEPVTPGDRWSLMLRHTSMALASGRYGSEKQTLEHMRGRLMAYVHGLPGAKRFRQQFSTLTTLTELQEIAAEALGMDGEAVPAGGVKDLSPIGY
jgi:tRNA-dihydrouridine synthase B